MSRVNGGRVVLGGLAAGFVMNLIDASVNGILLANQWKEETTRLNPGLMTKSGLSATGGWIVVDFILGILLVWIYAAIRPRFGAGAATAMRAAFIVWLIGHLVYASYVFGGLYSASLIGASSLGGLVATCAGGYLGGWLYHEEGLGV